MWYASGDAAPGQMTLRLASFLLCGLLCGLPPLAGCATGSSTDAKAGPRYPRRRPGCALDVFYTPTPGVPAWDDIGVAQVGCHLDEGEIACLHRLRVEACRMGGDILYDMPRRAARPGEREMVMRARVAHTRAAPGEKPDNVPAPASHEPVIPIGAPVPTPVPTPAPAPVPAPVPGGGVVDGGAPD